MSFGVELCEDVSTASPQVHTLCLSCWLHPLEKQRSNSPPVQAFNSSPSESGKDIGVQVDTTTKATNLHLKLFFVPCQVVLVEWKNRFWILVWKGNASHCTSTSRLIALHQARYLILATGLKKSLLRLLGLRPALFLHPPLALLNPIRPPQEIQGTCDRVNSGEESLM